MWQFFMWQLKNIFYSNIYKNIVFFCLSLSQHYISLKILQKKKKTQQKTKKKHWLEKTLYTTLYVSFILHLFI